ncbi:MAG: folate-binding protein [Rhodoferax sp.]|nr:folate-binding protein [Rhodoferax sp.]
MHYKLNGVAPLPHLGVIRVEGDDAAKFLHGQLTQDFSLLGLSEARLAGFCSAKGRMQASFIGFKRSPTEVLLVCQQDVLAATLKRLSMFVMRAKAKLTDATADYALFGLAGDVLDLIAPAAMSAWVKQDLGAASLVSLYPADGVRRALWLAPVTEAAPAGSAMSTADWNWGEVRSGIAMVTTPIHEAFVPQMLNYESVGGVNFKKGCYPGQEVVARSQFRGTLKRRAYLAHAKSPMQVGDEVFQADDEAQPCGLVALAAVSPLGGFDAIVSMQVSAFEANAVHLGAASGELLTLAAPPYPLLADI